MNTIIQKASDSSKGPAIQNILTWLKQAEDAATTQGMLGLEKTIKELAAQPSKVQGGYHVLDYAANHVRWDS